ncbi:hypothetical protein PISMIDRAFT_489360 [Pisolithus microcarpus 441]|uniref:Uncharacterized protein n=1 Tax=Pisolithus microcarpus 441 TaxID=765257 RepID=A0A0C9ZUF5_9AGAM|nr:hypothetical protein PISMIDRAFT_489360 [Pisolithus microcarpus 441]
MFSIICVCNGIGFYGSLGVSWSTSIDADHEYTALFARYTGKLEQQARIVPF